MATKGCAIRPLAEWMLWAKSSLLLQEKEIRRIGSAAVIPIDVRVIAATNVNIREQIALGKFRSDLLYRLNALEISIPLIRQRVVRLTPSSRAISCFVLPGWEGGRTPPGFTSAGCRPSLNTSPR